MPWLRKSFPESGSSFLSDTAHKKGKISGGLKKIEWLESRREQARPHFSWKLYFDINSSCSDELFPPVKRNIVKVLE